MCYIYYVNSETHIYIYTYIYIQIHKYTHLFIVNTEIRLFCKVDEHPNHHLPMTV